MQVEMPSPAASAAAVQQAPTADLPGAVSAAAPAPPSSSVVVVADAVAARPPGIMQKDGESGSLAVKKPSDRALGSSGAGVGMAGIAAAAAIGSTSPSSTSPPTSPTWSGRLDINEFKKKKVDTIPTVSSTKGTPLPKKTRKRLQNYYDHQNELIECYEAAEEQIEQRLTGPKNDEHKEEDVDKNPAVKFAINISFAANLCLFAAKLVAAVYSGSLAIIASVVDSSLDLLSGSILWCASRIAARQNKHKWPVGKSRLEPIAIIIFASVMGTAALQVIIEGVTRLVDVLVTRKDPGLEKVDALAYGIIAAVVVVKSVLWFICHRLRKVSATCDALAQDHRNDVCTNTATVIVLVLISRYPSLWWLDPVTAIAIGLMIIAVWASNAKGYVQQLTGRVAEKDKLSMITWLAANHDERITHVDTVRGYYIGLKLLVELDIVMSGDLPLRTAHDVAESLQMEIERLDFVERCVAGLLAFSSFGCGVLTGPFFHFSFVFASFLLVVEPLQSFRSLRL